MGGGTQHPNAKRTVMGPQSSKPKRRKKRSATALLEQITFKVSESRF
jgi:hypothetical protein